MRAKQFQFPSNGKVLSDITNSKPMRMAGENVSIPFKRESPFGPKMIETGIRILLLFQFPSNGKVLSDRKELQIIHHKNVSFNSLQTGKSFRTCQTDMFGTE